MTVQTFHGYDAGWTYTQDRKPVAFIMPPNEPQNAIIVPQPSWWQALRFSLTFAALNGCEYIGGPGQ